MNPVASPFEKCPQCGSNVTNGMQMTGEWSWSRCDNCGWDSERRPDLYTPEEVHGELLAAADNLLSFIHVSSAVFASDAMWRSDSTRLRDRADAIDAKDAAITRFQWALNRLRAVEIPA